MLKTWSTPEELAKNSTNHKLHDFFISPEAEID